MGLGRWFGRLPPWLSRRLYPALRYTNLMRAVEVHHLKPWTQVVQGSHVLDVGCGHGLYSMGFALRGACLVGCDLSSASLQAANEIAEGMGLDGGHGCGHAAYLVADGAGLPLAAEHFDLVICNCVLEHIVDDLGALRGMHRVLKPGGLLYLTVDNADHDLALANLESLSGGSQSRLLRPEVAGGASVKQALDDYLASTYAVQRRYHAAELGATLQALGFDVLHEQSYLSTLGAAHYEAFHLFRGLDTGRSLGRLAYMLTSAMLYPFAILMDRVEEGRGYGLLFVCRKGQPA
jgi:SAM-dependent methyltransferase